MKNKVIVVVIVSLHGLNETGGYCSSLRGDVPSTETSWSLVPLLLCSFPLEIPCHMCLKPLQEWGAGAGGSSGNRGENCHCPLGDYILAFGSREPSK